MGGTSSQEYHKFREYCYNAFLILRRYKNSSHDPAYMSYQLL